MTIFSHNVVEVILLLCFVGVSNSDAQGGAHYESHISGKPRVIIFVHGFTGSAADTWRASNGGHFPTLVATDNRIKQANVFVVSYDTHWTEDNGTISKLALSLSQQLDNFAVVSDHKELIFICHSLGGLVVEQMLIDKPELAVKTAFILFYGTPHEGAFSESVNPITSFVAAFAKNAVIPELRAGSGNAVLVKLDKDWKNQHLGKVRRFCAIEAYPTHVAGTSFAGLVVPYFSGAYGCDSDVPVETVYADHIGMVKPDGRSGKSGQAYVIFFHHYKENPFFEIRTIDDGTRDYRHYLTVDCNHTNSGTIKATFSLNSFYNEELLEASARFDDRSNIKDINPNPPVVQKLSPDSVNVQFGFNGLDKDWIGSCPGGGHATLRVRGACI